MASEREAAFGTTVTATGEFAEAHAIAETDFSCYMIQPMPGMTQWLDMSVASLVPHGDPVTSITVTATMTLRPLPDGQPWTPDEKYELLVSRVGGYAPGGQCSPQWSLNFGYAGGWTTCPDHGRGQQPGLPDAPDTPAVTRDGRNPLDYKAWGV